MLSPDLIVAFKAAVAEAARTKDRRAQHLKRVVYSVVDDLKAAGMPPERVIVMLRELISDTPDSRRYPFVGDFIAEWCLERYYGESSVS